jgi:rRNA maturation protein Nop10
VRNRQPLLCDSRDDCPTCGESIFDTKHIELHACRVGVKRPSWTLYHCPLCGTWFKIFWPSLRVTVEHLVAIRLAERRVARGETV